VPCALLLSVVTCVFLLNELQCLVDTGVITLFLSMVSCGLFIKTLDDGRITQTCKLTFL
jgi:hypothetical protein